MNYTLFDRTIALAGLYQCVSLVQQLAKSGMMDVFNFEVVISSLLHMNPSNTQDVYGNLENLRSGFELIQSQLGNSKSSSNTDMNRYVITLLHLERKVSNNNTMLNSISDRLANMDSQLKHFPITHENTLANIASIYTDTISTLSPKIMVQGEQNILSQSINANKIRSLLLAGIRSAVLWHQVGGTRWQLLLKRKDLVNEAQSILNLKIPRTIN